MTTVTRLVALDLPAGDSFVAALNDAWSHGHVVLPLDQRMPVGTRRRLAAELGADEIVGVSGRDKVTDQTNDLVALQSDDAIVIATSGTSGRPKGVIHTHASLRAHAVVVGERLGLSAEDHWWLCLPPAHIGGFGVVSRSMHFGSRLSVAPPVDASAIADAVSRGANRTSVVPTLLARHDFGAFMTVLVGGSRSASLPENAVSTYGLTESCGGVVYDGVPLGGIDLRIVEGEIQLRSPTLARSYRHGPLNLSDGWLRTGDLGQHRDGRLVVEGRGDDMIITGGYKVWPHVVEQRLREHPLVADVVVRGVPDAEWGSLVCAWAVPRTRTHAPTLDMLRGHVKESLAEYCAPRRLVLVDDIPRSTIGKVLTSELPS